MTQIVRAYLALDIPDPSTAQQLANGLARGDWKMLQIVKELGGALTSEVDATRAKGVELLSSLMVKMDKELLDRQMTKTLTTFFVDKLSEKTSLVPCATALTELTSCPTFGTGEGMEVARGVLSSVNLKVHPQAIRHSVYVLLDHLMTHSRPALKRLGNDFIAGYCALVEGEKDPRNLMISFSVIKVILLEFDIVQHVEDLFDITFCYFPITFTPPPDDPYGISSEDLIVALRGCLSATPLFGRLALPLFLDKMQAASEKAKRQTLQALIACFPIYGAEVSGEWAGRFSEALIIEVFHASDGDMQDLALHTFRSLYATLYPDHPARRVDEADHTTSEGGDVEMSSSMDAEDEKIEGVAVKAVLNSLDELQEPDKNNAKPAVRILTAFIAASNRLARYVIKQTLPPLLELYKDQDQIALRPSILSHVATLLSSMSEHEPEISTSAAPLFFPPTLSHASGESPLEPFRDDLLTIFTSSSRALTCRNACISGLVALLKIPAFLSSAEIDFCVSAINDVLIQPDGDEYYDAALDALVVVARLFPRTVEYATLPILFRAFPSSPTPGPASQESEAYRRALEALAALCLRPDLFEIFTLRLTSRLEEILSFAATSPSDFTAATLYAHHILEALRAVLQEKIRRNHHDASKYIERFVPGLCALFILPTLRRSVGEMEDRREVAKDPRLLIDVGKVVNLVVQRVDLERQTAFSRAVNEAFHRGKLEMLLGSAGKGTNSADFQPFASSSPTSQQNLVSLFTSLLLAMRPAVSLPSTDLLAFLRSFLARSLVSQNEIQLVAVLHLLSNSVNKRVQDVGEFVDEDLPRFYAENVKDGSKPLAVRRSALRVYTWVAKGLIVRSDQRGYPMVDQLLDLFHDSELGRTAATSLSAIAEEKDRVLSKENFAVIRLLYKQRFFTYLLPKLLTSHKAASSEDQVIYLTALSSVLQHIPKQLTLSELPKLLPLLITALDLPDPLLRANVIDALAVLVKEVPAEMENSISGIATKVLKGLIGGPGPGGSPAQARSAAQLRLSSLSFLASLPTHIPYLALHSQKAVVLKELGKAVDDPRKDVRRAAVECRSKWFLYSG
ncbi:DNA repair/transcription protein [Rhodotorula toruloides]|uniref:MMS19 nucleotide excision repair protein n=1 Tax=Rhodotorula toruloides TaxID=5286 RepID=A0A511KE79_RHOTO|nr:DNA repair/transcription protein [Rhodotorula toruloides]